VHLAFSPDPAYVRTIRLVATAVARRAGVADELLDEVRLAIGEACTRAVAMHRRHGLSDLIDVAMSDGGRFVVRVTDRGPTHTEGQDASTRAERPGGHSPDSPNGAVVLGTASQTMGPHGVGAGVEASETGGAQTGDLTGGVASNVINGMAGGGAGEDRGTPADATVGDIAVNDVDTADAETVDPGPDAVARDEDEDDVTASVGLALLTALVHDLAVVAAPDGSGTEIRMSWPVHRR
jgi:anti-sigma regulatory factor (Ser/Thr protein kinase)